MAAGHQAGTSREGGKDQEHGGDLPALVAHQGIPDRRLLPAQAEGRGDEGGHLHLQNPRSIAEGRNADCISRGNL